MATYSNSKINTFETCPYQYKLRYIDKIMPEIPGTIEAFMGDLVHQTLEKMYKDRKFKKRVALASLLKFFKDLWEKEYSKDILIAKEDEGLKPENYKKMGIEFISNYYKRYKNDDLTILGLETQDRMTLKNGDQWHVRIDKLCCDNQGNYYVCDYKTNARIKLQEEADSDRQLAMYSIWVKDKFKDAKKVILKWHMLAFDKDITSERSDEELKELEEDVISVIKDIEEASQNNDFPTNTTKLCDYCLYKEMCPSFKHEFVLEKKAEESIKKFKDDDGLKLVDDFSEIKTKIKELNDKEEELKANLIEFAKQKDIDIVYGSNAKASIKEFDKIILPEDKAEFLALLKEKGIYDACSMICYPTISSKFRKGDLHEDVSGKIKTEKDWRISLSKR